MRKEWLEKDYYSTLGVDKDASDKAIKKAFRQLAQQYHPDANPGDATAETRFKDINEAYDVVGDAETRKEYDRIQDMGYFVGGPGGQSGQPYVRVEDLFGGADTGGATYDVFGGLGDLFARQSAPRQRPGQDLTTEIGLTFHQAISGVTRELNVGGQTVKVKIPQGVADGTRIRVKGKGAPGTSGGPAGDLYVLVNTTPHPLFERSGKKDLRITAPITFVEAALGADITVPTLEGSVKLRIPAGTPHGKTFRVQGRGVTDAKDNAGDLLVAVEVTVPTDLTEEQKALLEKFRDNGPEDNPRSHLGV
ncbi:MAG: DnaJ domain-containing protein [Acidimicrobiia bacterium]|nr:DnaJ domain-containing protein [Acidimicrobiia bacterium]